MASSSPLLTNFKMSTRKLDLEDKSMGTLVRRCRNSTQTPLLPRSLAQNGQASLEMLLALLILLPLLFGGIELTRGVGIRHALDSGVGVAARALSLDPTQWDWARQVIQDSVEDNVLGGGSASQASVKVFNESGTEISSSGLAALDFGDSFRLESSVSYTPWLPLIEGGGNEIVIRVSHWGIVERYP